MTWWCTRGLLALAWTIALAGCIAELRAPVAPPADGQGTRIVLDDGVKRAIEGVYSVDVGNAQFGDTVVLRLVRSSLCLYTNNDVIFAELPWNGRIDPWWFTGTFRSVRSGYAASFVLIASYDRDNPGSVHVSGWFADDRALSLQRVRPLATEPFYIIAHRGGGRNSDRLLRSENSVEMVRYAEVLGANAVEIDIKRTRDDHLIVFHDETFSPRTVQGSFLLGDVNEFSLHDIQRYGRLVHGERIPTLDEMLTAIIDSTSLELVWLDVKDAEATDAIIAAQERAIGRAQQKGRRIELVFGIPTEDVLRAYYASPRANRAPVLLELDAAHIENLPSCSIWAPRWTNGISQGQVDEMHARGIKVVTWTLDVREYMQQFVRDVRLDGILTNYPSLLCGMYYLL